MHAVKIIMENSFPAERIEREIAAARVTHPNVVKLIDVKEPVLGGEKRVALVFEFVDGSDLATILATSGPLTAAGVRFLAHGLFAGLQAIHGDRVIHRDVKPENLQLRRGQALDPVILDLGLAHVADLSSLTHYPTAMGTTAFMAPEILRGEHALARSDIFATGVTLHIAATGGHPWLAEGHTVTSVDYQAMINGNAPSAPSGDNTLDQVIAACLHPKAFLRPTATKALTMLS